MNKHVAWISGIALTAALSVGLIAPALAFETPAAPEAPATVAAPVASVHAPAFTTTDDFAPKTVPTVTVAKASEKKASKPVVKKQTTRKAAVKRTTSRTATAAKSTRTTSTNTAAAKPASTKPASSSSDDLATAKSVLASLQNKYKYLDGVTVKMGDTPNNYQAVAYMGRGVIVINPKHTASISTILKHEIWHIIDYRDNGKIDWGERVAPKNAADYLK